MNFDPCAVYYFALMCVVDVIKYEFNKIAVKNVKFDTRN